LPEKPKNGHPSKKRTPILSFYKNPKKPDSHLFNAGISRKTGQSVDVRSLQSGCPVSHIQDTHFSNAGISENIGTLKWVSSSLLKWVSGSLRGAGRSGCPVPYFCKIW